MEVDLLWLFLLASSLTASVQSAPREKHKSLSRWPQHSEDKDDGFPKVQDTILSTFFPFESSSPGLGETSRGGGGGGNDEVYSVDLEVTDGRSMSEEMLAQLMKASEDDEVDRVEIKNHRKQQQQKEKHSEKEEMGSSTDSEIPVDLDYFADVESPKFQPEEIKPLVITFGEKEKVHHELPTVMEDYKAQPNQDYEDRKDKQQEKPARAMSTENPDEQILPDPETETSNTNQNKKSKALEKKTFPEVKDGEKDENESVRDVKEKPKASLLCMTGVQIRALSDLSPKVKPTAPPKSRTEDDPGHGDSVDSCENFHCKRGKTCRLNDKKKPSCVCQEPADCPPTLSEFDHVCGTDNQTYDSSCRLFAIKCSLEGSRKGHRLHLDYTGSCKFIAPCLKTELIYFPLRMKDWMKNILLQLYQQDSLTSKQRSKVQQMYVDERRLHAGDHRDFEKNDRMYVYPVHWQFAQLDRHPSDRFLSDSELSPLRAPLVPMEHCTSVFFQVCDADKDQLLSFREWCQCFGIGAEDMDSKLLF